MFLRIRPCLRPRINPMATKRKRGPDERTQPGAEDEGRCPWARASNPDLHALYIRYHDEEWGMPIIGSDKDSLLFEMLSLEGAQAGPSG